MVLLLAGAGAGIWIGAFSSSTSGSPGSARALERSALAAALRSGSFHYVSTSVGGGQDQTTVGDAQRTSGRQAITINGDTFDVVVVGAQCFFKGDAAAVVENLGLPSADAGSAAGKWVSLATTDGPYQSVYAAVTTKSALDDNITFTPTLEITGITVDGRSVTEVRGAMHGLGGGVTRGTATLYVADGSDLPVRYVESGSVTATGGGTTALDFRIDFSNWGEHVPVTAPAGAVAFAGLPGANSTGSGSPGSTPGTTIVA
ncbi:MAG: hypothetical protein ACYDD4_12105 [Acidimicrobiales bacterium]